MPTINQLVRKSRKSTQTKSNTPALGCLLYTSDAADDLTTV